MDKERYNWYMVYTTYPNELKVKDILDIADIESYIPTKTVDFIWGNEKITREIPAIPTCLFIRIQPSDFAMVQYMREISFFTNKEGNIPPISDSQMQTIRETIEKEEDPSTHIKNILTTI